ncbi:hypothetical protein Tco_0282136 [Tanacetum coccineum]
MSFRSLAVLPGGKLSKETGCDILPSRDGSRGKAFKPIASVIAKGKINASASFSYLQHQGRESTSFRKSLRCWFGSSDRSPWNEYPFCTNRMVSDRRCTTLFPSGSSMVFR